MNTIHLFVRPFARTIACMTTNLSPLRFALAWSFLLSLSFSAACGGASSPPPVEDSHTLRVDIGIYVDRSLGSVGVVTMLNVTVRDPDTGTPLVDASCRR